VSVYATDTANYVRGSSFQTDGTYSVVGLTAGSYKLQFQAAGFVRQYWDNETSFLTGDAVALTSGQKLIGQDVALQLAGSISGTIKDTDGNAITGGGYISVYDSAAQNYVTSGYFGTDGNYSLSGLSPGSYKLQFSPTDNYPSQWWDNKPTWAAADSIMVVGGQDSNGKNVILSSGASISGTIRDSSGVPITSGGSVYVYDATSQYSGFYPSGTIQSDGTFSVQGLPAGSYKLQFSPGGSFISQWWNNKGSYAAADAITVTDGQSMTNKDVEVTAGATISGTIRDSVGNTITGGGYVYAWPTGSSSGSIPMAPIQDNGTYLLQSLPTGSYKLEFRPSGNYVGQWWNNKTSLDSSDVLTLVAGQALVNKNVTLAAGASISGIVHDTFGNPISAGGSVYVYDSVSQGLGYNGTIQSDGSYTVLGLPAGSYKVEYRPNGNFISEWWNDKTTFASADTLTLTAAQALEGTNVTLDAGASISGTVYSQGTPSTPLAGVSVAAIDPVTYENVGSATTASDGTFTMSKVRKGTFTIVFDGSGLTPARKIQLLGNASSFPASTTFSVAEGAVISGKNATLVGRVASTPPPSPIPTVTNPTGRHDIVTWSQPSSTEAILGYCASGSSITLGGGGGGGGCSYGADANALSPDGRFTGSASFSTLITMQPFTASTHGETAHVVLNDIIGTPLQTPPTVTITARTSTTLSVTWEGQSSPAEQMENWNAVLIGGDFVPWGQVTAPNPLTYTFTGLTPGITYSVAIYGSSSTATTSWGLPISGAAPTPTPTPIPTPTPTPTPPTPTPTPPTPTPTPTPTTPTPTTPTPTPTPGSGSVAGTNPNFVRGLYRNFLGRTASADEVNYWAGELNAGRATQASLTTILSTSDEWIRVVIRGFYVDTLGREPDAAGYQYWIDRARSGEPIADIGAFFYGSDEYFDGFGSANNHIWISDLYTKLMLRSADSGGVNYWLTQLNSGMSRTAVSRWFYQSPEKLGLRVDALYSKLLGRGSDPGGRIYWSGVLTTAGDLRLASFLASSPEYFGRRFTG
jgi:cell division septation protein DedD